MWKQTSTRNASKEQVLAWIKRYQEEKDDEAQTRLVENYQYLVESIARKYSNGRS